MKKTKSLALLGCAVGLGSLLAGCNNESAPRSLAIAQVQSQQVTYPAYTLEAGAQAHRLKVSATTAAQREFTLFSSQSQRDDKPQKRVVTEQANKPRVVSGSVVFDSLFALSMDDLQQASVSAIKDGSYNDGKAIPCECFETGEKWNYVWTRDLAYAADLSLAYFDPHRVKNSMEFKTSAFRAGATMPDSLPNNSLQIIQDTGSGGSWPVSTDRVTWAIAAETLLNSLHGSARREFETLAYRALIGTVEADRLASFDLQQGLYGGEQSYLDWRTQTYAPWIVDNLAQMSATKALSTNVAHYQALRLAARLAQAKGDTVNAQKYTEWAAALQQQINKKFWVAEKGLFASVTAAAEAQVPVHKFDMLGNALAILHGIASAEQAQQVMANYPHAPFGVPVYYPHQPEVYVYHNRALWPFVTAYSLRAAAVVNNYRAADNAIHSLVRGTALNLSNMENLEWLTAKPWFDDGPAINSRRQLWSIGAYLNMVSETFFGFHGRANGFVIDPFLTASARQLLGDGNRARLENFIYQGKSLAIELHLPEATNGEGYYPVASVTLNGKPVSGEIAAQQLNHDSNLIEVSFAPLTTNDQGITMAPVVDPLSHNSPLVFSPQAPEQVLVDVVQGKFSLRFNHHSADLPAVYNIYRNGELVGNHIAAHSWNDNSPADLSVRQCFTVEAVFVDSSHRSHHSAPVCYEQQASQLIAVTDKRVQANMAVTAADAYYAEPTLRDWGKPQDTLRVNNIVVEKPGIYALQIIYNNRQHTIDSGVTNAVKQLVVVNARGDAVVSGVIQMPNVEDRAGQYPLRSSTALQLRLDAGEYAFSVHDFFNMSYLASNQTYVGSGGLAGPVNRASIAAFKLTRIGD